MGQPGRRQVLNLRKLRLLNGILNFVGAELGLQPVRELDDLVLGLAPAGGLVQSRH